MGSAVEGNSSSRHRRHYGAHDHVMYGPRPAVLRIEGLFEMYKRIPPAHSSGRWNIFSPLVDTFPVTSFWLMVPPRLPSVLPTSFDDDALRQPFEIFLYSVGVSL